MHRLRPLPGRADRLQLRHRAEARDPVPELRRQRNDGRRRAVDHQRRLLQHVLPDVPGVDRGAQLPRQPHRLPRAGQDGRQLPPRDEGPWFRSTGRSARTSGLLGSPQLRDPAVGPARQQARPPPERRTNSAARLAAQEPVQPRHHGPCSCWSRWLLPLPAHCCSASAAVDLDRRVRRTWRSPLAIVLAPRCSPSRTSSWSSALVTGVPGAAARSSARSTTPTSGGTSATGRCSRRRTSGVFNGTPFKSLVWRLLGVRIGKQGLRRRLRHDRSGRWSPSATTAPSTRAASSSATRWRTASSSPTASRSAPAARSASAPSSTTA